MRRRVRKEAIGVALFPFLAVLICTMGTLIVLLVLLVQQAHVDASTAAAQAAAAPTPEQLAERSEKLEDANWRREVLEQQREKKQEELATTRLELSHIEDHIRRLEDSARQLMARVQELETDKKEDLAPLTEELASLRRQIADKQAELEAKRRELAAKERSYTLIPYEGRNGTRRMPLYIECTEAGVIIQPEGVLLTPDDFRWLGPGNPLDAALRAKREHLAKVAGPGVEPYPLLVVRPSGIIAYGGAREAMKSWDDEFGYELVSEELSLDFGQRDPKLDQMLQKTVNDARRRQSLLAASIPRRYRQVDPITSFSPSDLPGMAPQPAGRSGRGVGDGSGGMGIGQSDTYSDGRAARPPGETTQPLAGGQRPPGSNDPDAPSPQPASGQSIKIQHGGSSREEGVQGGVAGAKSGKSLPAGAVARRRGANWGLPGAQGRTFAVTRPIRVACSADRLAILPDLGDDRAAQEFTLSPEMTVAEVDAFVAAIQKRISGWGLAAENGYWKPELRVDVAPGADARFEELKSALQGSGIDVQRKVR